MKKKVLCTLLVLILIILGILNQNNFAYGADQSGYKVGDKVYFGSYFQNPIQDDSKVKNLAYDDDGHYKTSNNRWISRQDSGKYFASEPIEWEVIESNNDTLLLLSNKILRSKDYTYWIGDERGFWENSDLRAWLNNGFMNYSFTDQEKNDILISDVKTFNLSYNDYISLGQGYVLSDNVNSYKVTQDKVYILDKYELEKYVGLNNLKAYATTWGGSTNQSAAQEWWIRGPAVWTYGNLVDIYVSSSGIIEDSNMSAMSLGQYSGSKGVRPVIRVKKTSKFLSKTYPEQNAGYYPFKTTTNTTTTKSNTLYSAKVEGKYKDGATKKVIKQKEFYKDAYFIQNSSRKRQIGLARISMLASSAVYTNEKNKTYAKDLMKKCKFTSIKYVKKNVKAKDNDHVSYCVGYKNVNDTTIIAVWVKGTSANYEWVSNFNVGKNTKTHLGFSKAEKEMNKSINSYIKSLKTNKKVKAKIKFWVTGHSRGAAVANLYAKRLTDKYGKSNVYAYTFASPRVSTIAKKSGYENIKNYLNIGDFVTELAPKKWGYKRYGEDINLTASAKTAMGKLFKQMTKKQYKGFGKDGKNSLLKAFLKYGGNNVKSYYAKHVGGTPAYFCKQGLALALNSDKKVQRKGVKNALKVASINPSAAKVLAKMVIDGKINDKFAHAHTQAAYLCWLDKMK